MDSGRPVTPNDPKVPGTETPIGTNDAQPPPGPARDASVPTDTGLGPIGPPGADASPPPGDECAMLGYLGRCDGNVSRWCSDGEIRTKDCASIGQRCEWISDSIGYYCTGAGTVTPPPTTDAGSPPRADSGTGTAPVPSDLTAAEQDLLRALNDERAAYGLPAVVIDPELQCAARRHVMDVGGSGACGHVGSDGTWPSDRANACGFEGTRVNEIAAGPGFTDGADAVSGWQQSSGHHRAIVLPEAMSVGVGVYNSCFIAVFDCCILGS